VNVPVHETIHLDLPQAKTMWGVMTRTIARCTAVKAGIWANRLLGRPDFAMTTLFPTSSASPVL